jgi:hypothetical protein
LDQILKTKKKNTGVMCCAAITVKLKKKKLLKQAKHDK